MARKSRKNAGPAAEIIPVTAPGTMTGIYVRLSIENSGKDDDGDSIENQISICKEFVADHSDLKLFDIYEDNGRKGTNFDRPGFNRLMDDVRSGKVKCIVVKDLSRFGRDYVEAGELLEKIFPFLGVRFISITDRYDSLTSSDAEDALMLPLKNMINEAYAKDIFRKIITSFRARQEKGEFLPAFVPYGYVKSKTQQYRLEIDPETAPYVKMIFEWKAAGISHNEICRRLNEMGAITPARRKVELGIWHAEKYKHTIWHGRSIIDILKNLTYTGCLVYGKMPKSLYEGIKIHRADADEWRVLPDMHEAIISRELYDRVQEIFREHTETANERKAKSQENRDQVPNLFEKRIYCGDCRKRMRFIKHADKRRDYKVTVSYACGGYIDSGHRNCSRHGISYRDVKAAVFSAIRVQLDLMLDQEDMIRKMRGTAREKNLIEQCTAKVAHLTQELKRVNSRRENLFENFVEGILDETDYRYAKKSYDTEYEKLELELQEAERKKSEVDHVLTGDNKWMESLHMADGISELNKELVDALIEKVTVFEGRRVEVEFKFAEHKAVLDRVIAALKEEGDGNE